MQSYEYEEANEVFPLSNHDPDETMESFHDNMEKGRLKRKQNYNLIIVGTSLSIVKALSQV